MNTAFGFTLEQYPSVEAIRVGALDREPPDGGRCVLDSLIETSIARDVLVITRGDKPAPLLRLFELGCRDAGQILSYSKMLGQLQDAGNTATLAHCLEFLSGAGMLTALSKYAGQTVRRRGSSPT